MSSLNEMISSREQLLNSYRGGGGAANVDSFSNSRGGTTLLGLQMSSHFGPGEGGKGSVSKLTAASSSLALAA